MRWFKRYSVCKECGVHFEPVTGYEERCGDLCRTHREPVMRADHKRDAVLRWAGANWEKLFDQMITEQQADDEAKKASGAESFNRHMDQAALMRSSAASHGFLWGLGPWPPGIPRGQ